jgi:hypothetical protein
MVDNPSTPIVEILPPESPPDHDTFVFLMMVELLAIQVLVERHEIGGL